MDAVSGIEDGKNSCDLFARLATQFNCEAIRE